MAPPAAARLLLLPLRQMLVRTSSSSRTPRTKAQQLVVQLQLLFRLGTRLGIPLQQLSQQKQLLPLPVQQLGRIQLHQQQLQQLGLKQLDWLLQKRPPVGPAAATMAAAMAAAAAGG